MADNNVHILEMFDGDMQPSDYHKRDVKRAYLRRDIDSKRHGWNAIAQNYYNFTQINPDLLVNPGVRYALEELGLASILVKFETTFVGINDTTITIRFYYMDLDSSSDISIGDINTLSGWLFAVRNAEYSLLTMECIPGRDTDYDVSLSFRSRLFRVIRKLEAYYREVLYASGPGELQLN